MQSGVTKVLVLMLVLAQVALGGAGGAGGVICLGGGESEPDSLAPVCCHSAEHGERPVVPVPVGPHDQECPCIDVPVPVSVGRIDSGRGADDVAAVMMVALTALPPPMVLVGIEQPGGVRLGFPPGPAPGLRTTRLNI